WALQGNIVGLEELAKSYPKLLSLRDGSGARPLHYAATGGSSGAIEVIVKAAGREELHMQDDCGNTPLHWAVEKNRTDSCVSLLKLGADPNILNQASLAPLHLAVSLRHNALVELLLSHGKTDANLEGDLGNTPVIMACSTDNHEALSILFEHEAKLCHQNRLGHFAIHAAAFAGAKTSMEIILQRGAKIDQQQCDKSTALHFACTQGATEVVKLMLSSYSRVEDIINITDGAMQTPLHRATIFDHVDLAEYLILKSVKELLSEEDSEGCTPLHYACRLGIPDSVQNMLGLQVSLGHKSKEKKSALHFAAEYGRMNTCQRLLDTMADTRLLNEGDEKGLTPLHLASRGGHMKVGWTCLHYAASEGFTQTISTLLNSNINLLDRVNQDGNTALHLAAKEGHTSAVRLLLNKGAEVILNKNDASFFHEAVLHGRKETANAVIESDRCEEVLSAFKVGSVTRCAIMDLIEFLPESCKVCYHGNAQTGQHWHL
ncbi:hypothetical protein JZ751_001006, partial [Albula glossodonta]